MRKLSYLILERAGRDQQQVQSSEEANIPVGLVSTLISRRWEGRLVYKKIQIWLNLRRYILQALQTSHASHLLHDLLSSRCAPKWLRPSSLQKPPDSSTKLHSTTTSAPSSSQQSGPAIQLTGRKCSCTVWKKGALLTAEPWPTTWTAISTLHPTLESILPDCQLLRKCKW